MYLCLHVLNFFTLSYNALAIEGYYNYRSWDFLNHHNSGPTHVSPGPKRTYVRAFFAHFSTAPVCRPNGVRQNRAKPTLFGSVQGSGGGSARGGDVIAEHGCGLGEGEGEG